MAHRPASRLLVEHHTAKAAAAVCRTRRLLPRCEAVGLQGLLLVWLWVCPSKQVLCSKQWQMSGCGVVAIRCTNSSRSNSSRELQSSRTHSG
jgi:hypothetical protein